MQSPLLTVLRRLEAQNVWRVAYSSIPRQATVAAADEDIGEFTISANCSIRPGLRSR